LRGAGCQILLDWFRAGRSNRTVRTGYCLYHYAVKEAESLRWQIAMALFCGQTLKAIAHWPHAEWLGASFLLDEL